MDNVKQEVKECCQCRYFQDCGFEDYGTDGRCELFCEGVNCDSKPCKDFDDGECEDFEEG